MAALVVGVIAVTAAALQIHRYEIASANPPPGKLIDVGGYRLHLHCLGEGKPTVLLEAGNNEFSLTWSDIQPRLAATAKVCSYDRAGLGWSDPSPLPRTVDNMVKELNTLATNSGLEPPFVLAGHSYGGYIGMRYAQQYPSQVKALVLIDSAHPQQFARIPSYFNDRRFEKFQDQFQHLQVLNKTGILALEPQTIPDHGLKEPALTEYRSILAATNYFKGALRETKALRDSFQHPETGPSKLDIPVSVIIRGKNDDMAAGEYATWRQLQMELAKMSRNSSLFVARHSGHYVQIDQPQFVAGVITNILSK
jgi:pimeloyl-ACP methyl ester carboxylesterase